MKKNNPIITFTYLSKMDGVSNEINRANSIAAEHNNLLDTQSITKEQEKKKQKRLIKLKTIHEKI